MVFSIPVYYSNEEAKDICVIFAQNFAILIGTVAQSVLPLSFLQTESQPPSQPTESEYQSLHISIRCLDGSILY